MMRATRTKASTRKTLLRAMHLDDASTFRGILASEGWPMDSEWSDYELLLYAVRHNHRRITHLLLDNGARVTNRKPRANTPLHLAATKKTTGWSRVIARLLSSGASVADKNGKGETALHLAFNNHAPDEVVDLLLKAHLNKSSVDVFNKDRLAFVHVASTRSNLDAVRELVEAHESLVNCQVSLQSNSTHAGYTPLHFAVDHGRLEVAEFLLRHGADIYKSNANGSTPLHLALEFRNIEMIDLILSYDEFKKNRINNFGVSHFMAACAGSNESLVAGYMCSPSSTSALLHSQVQSPNHFPNAGYTPLHFAAEFGRRRTVELLLARGADCCALTPLDLTPHMLAHTNNHEVIARLLDTHCHTCQWFTEAPKVLGNRYDKIVDQDEQGDVLIRFEKRNNSDSSSDDGSVNSDGSVSHENLVSRFMNDDSNDQTDRAVGNFDYNFFENIESAEVLDETSVAELSREDIHFHRAVVGLIGDVSKPSGEFDAVTEFQEEPLNLALPRYQVPSAVDQFPQQFSSFNAQAPLLVPNFFVPSLNTCNLIQVSAGSPTDTVQVPEMYSIPWPSFLSQSQFELTPQSINSDSAISAGSSFVSSYYTDSGVADASQFVNNTNQFYEDNPMDYVAPNAYQSFGQMDYSAFVPAASSTPNSLVHVAMERAHSFDHIVDVNNNQFVGVGENVDYYRSASFS